MLDVYKITSVLEKLPDAQLQQYASMHKQDPYVLSLAVEESNRRKRIRSAPQGQEQGQPPPVNEQAVQGMAPEDTGIAQLPAGNMDFADGGIVAFADGGATDAGIYQYLPEFLRRRIAENAEIAQSGRAAPAPEPAPTAELPGIMDALGYGYQRARSGLSDFLQRRVEQHAQDVSDVNIPGPPSRYAGMTAPGATPAPAPAEKQTPRIDVNGATPPPRSDARASGQTRESTVVRAPVGPRQDRLADLQRYETALGPGVPGTKERDQMLTEGLAGLKAAEDELQARMPKGKAYEGLEARLKKEEEGVGSKKEENLKMALINAGLGMMAGTSQFAAVNIGEGAKQGVKTYSEGLDKLEKAAEKRRELTTVIEEGRRAEERGDATEAYKRKREGVALTMEARKAQVDAIMSTHKVNRETGMKLVELQDRFSIAQMEAQRADARASAALKSQDTTVRRQALMELGRSLAAQLKSIDDQAKLMGNMLDPTKVEGQKRDLMQQIQKVNTALVGIAELPIDLTVQSAPPPGDRPPLTSFRK